MQSPVRLHNVDLSSRGPRARGVIDLEVEGPCDTLGTKGFAKLSARGRDERLCGAVTSADDEGMEGHRIEKDLLAAKVQSRIAASAFDDGRHNGHGPRRSDDKFVAH